MPWTVLRAGAIDVIMRAHGVIENAKAQIITQRGLSPLCTVESLLDLLPEVFDKSDLIALRVKRKQSTTKQSIGTILMRWKKAGKIEQVEGLAKYRQLKKN